MIYIWRGGKIFRKDEIKCVSEELLNDKKFMNFIYEFTDYFIYEFTDSLHENKHRNLSGNKILLPV